MVLELLFTVLPPVYEGAIFGFYVATFSLLMYGSFSFIEACKYYVFKKEVMYMLAVFIAFLLILVSLLGVSASLMVWTVGTLVHPNQPVLKDWVRFYAMLLVESLIVILFLEIVIGPMRSGEMIFTRAWSTTDVSSFFSLSSTGYFRLTDQSAAGIHDSDAGVALADLSLQPPSTRGSADGGPCLAIRDLETLASDHDATYSYSPLAQSDIRLLRIHPFEERTDPLHASLEHKSILSAQSQQYVALSYTWGSMNAVVPILVDGKVLRIRPNLANILQLLRGLRTEYVWIDAICVNQGDVVERNAQVTRMRAIYAGARTVLVATDTATTGECDKLVPLLTSIEPTLDLRDQAAQVIEGTEDGSVISALDVLCNDPYWSRVWIIQEFALASRAELLFGLNIINFTNLEWLLNATGTRGQIRKLCGIRKAWQNNRPPQLIDILHRTRGSRCSVRHDRIFGLMGLSPESLRYLPEPNYETDLITTTLAMTRAYIEKTSLDLILLAPHRVLVPALPSWSLDLFNLDIHPFEQRSFELVLDRQDYRSRQFTRGRRRQDSNFWNATRGVISTLTYQGNIMQTIAGRIGGIRSLGKAWSDPFDSSFPAHDPTWRRKTTAFHLREELAKLMMNGQNAWGIEGYCYLRVFLASHGDPDPAHQYGDLQIWICGNRTFFVGVDSLEECAKALRHPLLLYGPLAYKTWELSESHHLGLFQHMMWRAQYDMRMMCLDAGPKWRIGWAAKGAWLNDEVFLIPGCSSPVILRKNEDGRYQVIGDAIVHGTMKSEYWGTLKAEDIQHIEVI